MNGTKFHIKTIIEDRGHHETMRTGVTESDRRLSDRETLHVQGLPESGESKVIPKVACDQSQEGIAPLSSLGRLSSALVVHDVPMVRLAAHSHGHEAA